MTREDIFARARSIKTTIASIRADVASWNKNGRKPSEEPIDPDPDGTLATLDAYCDGILNGEVYVAPERVESNRG